MQKGNNTRKSRSWPVGMAVIIGVCLAGLGTLGYWSGLLPRYETELSFYAPVFSEDKSMVYYLTRESSGFSWGPGWESFTPPAKVIITNDSFHLERTALEDGRIERLYTLDVPHLKTPQSRYRNRLFGIPFAELNWQGRNLQIRISVIRDRARTEDRSSRIASEGTWFEHDNKVTLKQEWQNDTRVFVPWNRHTLSESWEVVSLKGKAIIIADKDWQRKIVLRRSPAMKKTGEEYLASIQKEQYSHREDIERNVLVSSTYSRILNKFKRQGLTEHEALLRTSDEMESLGLYPKGPKIVAKEVKQPKEGLPVFQISGQEFFVGMFRDIDKAIKQPGTEIDFWGNYVRHRDYDTSTKINKHLKQGGTAFNVTTGGKVFLMEVTRGQ